MKQILGMLVVFLLIVSLGACQAGTASTPDVTPTATEEPAPTEPPADPTEAPGGPSMDSEPPPATLTVDGQTQTGGIGTYCWDMMCVDMIGIPTPQEPLVVSSPADATLTFAFEEPPTTIGVTVFPATESAEMDEDAREYRWWAPQSGESIDVEPALETNLTFELEPGTYVVQVFTAIESEGDASYGFLIEVQ